MIDKPKSSLSKLLLLAAASVLLSAHPGHTQQQPNPAEAAGQIADFFGKVGDQIYENCIFELSDEQIEVQHALVAAYIEHGANGAAARKLAAKQIQPPKLSAECEQIRDLPRVAPPPAEAAIPPGAWEPKVAATPKPKTPPAPPAPPARAISLASKKVLPQWDCAEGVDYVTIQHKGYPRKLTGGEICNPFQDVVHEVPTAVGNFRLGYTIKTGRLFVITEGGARGQTVAWAISGREVCRNNPDPDCLATRAVGPLPPGEYTFSANKDQRVTWGPTIKRYVVGVYMKKLWGKELYSPQQTSAILARGNIAIHERLKGEMSEACLGLEPNGWAYVAALIKNARATGLSVYVDEPYPQVAENPPIVVASSFSLTSIFK